MQLFSYLVAKKFGKIQILLQMPKSAVRILWSKNIGIEEDNQARGGGGQKNWGKKLGTLKTGGGKIDPLARIYTSEYIIIIITQCDIKLLFCRFLDWTNKLKDN